MAEDSVCPRCGSHLAPDAVCQSCDLRRGRALTLGGEAGVLAILSGLAVVFFLLTNGAVNSYRAKERELGKEWAEKGHALLRASDPARAVEAFQTSLRYQPDSRDVRYAMVDSLLAAGRSDQARSYLLSLWENQPANGIINLDLARIAGQRDDISTATRYYHNAIYGVWDSSPQEQRIQVRLELIRFLLRHEGQREADAELVSLAANAPPSPDLSLEIARGFFEAGDLDAAFDQFAGGLRASPHDARLLAGAGKAAFLRGRYAEAREYLEKARAEHSKDTEAERLYQLTQLIQEHDPFDRRVSWSTRSERALKNLAQSESRLEQCAAQITGGAGAVPAELSQALEEVSGTRKRATMASLRRDPDLLLRYSSVSFTAEELAARLCAPPQGLDEALLLIGRHHPEAAR